MLKDLQSITTDAQTALERLRGVFTGVRSESSYAPGEIIDFDEIGSESNSDDMKAWGRRQWDREAWG